MASLLRKYNEVSNEMSVSHATFLLLLGGKGQRKQSPRNITSKIVLLSDQEDHQKNCLYFQSLRRLWSTNRHLFQTAMMFCRYVGTERIVHNITQSSCYRRSVQVFLCPLRLGSGEGGGELAPPTGDHQVCRPHPHLEPDSPPLSVLHTLTHGQVLCQAGY